MGSSLIVTGSLIVAGSLIATESLIGSLTGSTGVGSVVPGLQAAKPSRQKGSKKRIEVSLAMSNNHWRQSPRSDADLQKCISQPAVAHHEHIRATVLERR